MDIGITGDRGGNRGALYSYCDITLIGMTTNLQNGDWKDRRIYS